MPTFADHIAILATRDGFEEATARGRIEKASKWRKRMVYENVEGWAINEQNQSHNIYVQE